MMTPIQKELFSLQDLSYRDFHSKLMPTVNKDNVIGVRTPELRKYAKQITGTKEAQLFMQTLPHRYYEENNLHGFLIALIKDYDLCIKELDPFLPYVDNWATCDGMSPKALRKQPDKLLEKIRLWLKSEHTYTVRFAVKCLIDFFLDENFSEEILSLVASVKSDEYYVNMCCSWFFQAALVKQFDSTIPYFTEKRLSSWVHNKAIQKAIESYRVDEGTKKFLRGLKI